VIKTGLMGVPNVHSKFGVGSARTKFMQVRLAGKNGSGCGIGMGKQAGLVGKHSPIHVDR